MDHLQTNMRSRDMHVVFSERWCDPRAKLLRGAAWDEHKIPVCRSLNLSIDFDEEFGYLSSILEDKYQNVLQRLPQNDAIEIVKNSKGKDRIKLSRLEKIEEPESLKILKSKIDKLMPRIDFPEYCSKPTVCLILQMSALILAIIIHAYLELKFHYVQSLWRKHATLVLNH
ncbi:hypothetical protein PGH45_19290 [Legionella pneumophila]|nr:hypothetical protein [Legionella pneumophila]